jgi:hypothetical protein
MKCDAYDPGRHFRCTLEAGHAGQHAMAMDPIPKQREFWTRRQLFDFLTERMCLCGSPEEALATLLRLLEWIDDRPTSSTPPAEWSKACDDRQAKLDAWCPDEGTQYLLFYWLDHEDITEHGGAVPGWLTKKGEGLKGALERESGNWRAFIELGICGDCGGDGCAKCDGGIR